MFPGVAALPVLAISKILTSSVERGRSPGGRIDLTVSFMRRTK